MRFQEGTFNTIGQRQAQFGGNFPVWDRVRELYKGGGKIDASQFAPGTVIGAGTMVKFNGSGQKVEIITANGVEGVKEVDKVTVTSGCTTNGNVGIKLNNASVVNIVVTTAENTPESVAAKIAAGSFSGWTAKQDGASVIFTKSASGPCAAPVVEVNSTGVKVNSTGVKATAEVVTAGAAANGSLDDVNGLIFEDVCIPEGCILATCAVVRAGRIYADRVNGGGIPKAVEKQLPMIEFVRED